MALGASPIRTPLTQAPAEVERHRPWTEPRAPSGEIPGALGCESGSARSPWTDSD